MTDWLDTRIRFRGDEIDVQRTQDVEDILENAKELAKQPNPTGDHFWDKWTLPNVIVEQFYIKYNEGRVDPKPMNQEFWLWVDKEVMTNPDYSRFRTGNKSRPFVMGYDK